MCIDCDGTQTKGDLLHVPRLRVVFRQPWLIGKLILWTLRAEKLGRGTGWLDIGTGVSLLDVSSFVRAVQSRQGLMVACPEEIGFHQGWLSEEDLAHRAARLGKSSYGAYLRQLAVVPLQ